MKFECIECYKQYPCILEVPEGSDNPFECPYNTDNVKLVNWKSIEDNVNSNNIQQLKIMKTDPNAMLPFYATDGAIAMDLTAVNISYNKEYGYIEYDTGIAIQLPSHLGAVCTPRSSNSKMEVILSNSVGLIDQDYLGSIKFRYKLLLDYNEVNLATLRSGEFRVYRDKSIINDCGTTYNETIDCKIYRVGDRIGQLMIIPIVKVTPVLVDKLEDSKRGTGGFGSTGR